MTMLGDQRRLVAHAGIYLFSINEDEMNFGLFADVSLLRLECRNSSHSKTQTNGQTIQKRESGFAHE